MSVDFELNGEHVSVGDARVSLLEALREQLGVRSPKDGCSPQGQCGCCTVLVDAKPRVACVTPVTRVRGRTVTTIEGLSDGLTWAQAFCDAGASQCGFCSPGIIMRLSALTEEQLTDRSAVDKALLAHLCRCTGWQTVRDACVSVAVGPSAGSSDRDLAAAEQRAALEGGARQSVAARVALGDGGFSDDAAPADALAAVLDADGDWVVSESLHEARAVAGKVQGRRTTAAPHWPIAAPDGDWQRTLQTTWIEPGYLEPDTAWCRPGGDPSSSLGNGGAFGGKVNTPVRAAARRLADEHGRPVRAVWSREDTVRLGAKRPPVAISIGDDGTGIARLARPTNTADEHELVESIESVAPGVVVEFVDVVGPPVSASLRAAGWAEVAAVLAAVEAPAHGITSPDGATASAVVQDERVDIVVECGDPLDETVLRSYCIGAAHMALGMVRSEAIALDADGVPLDLTIRSFGILRAVDTPEIHVEIRRSSSTASPPVNGSDAVFAAVLAAAWRHAGHPLQLPIS